MALREIREIGAGCLNKKCKEVREMTERLSILIDDMIETMHEAQGVGLAAPQVGVLRNIVVVDVSEEGNDPIVLINPKLLDTSGEQKGVEGCLSVPGKVGYVTRPNYAKVGAFDRNMNPIVVEGEELLARALCHELDHLEGRLYVDMVEGRLMTNEEYAELTKEEEENGG